VLYGFNHGHPVRSIDLPEVTIKAAEDGGFDLKGFSFSAAQEQLRRPRIVRVGLVQNSIKAPTTAPFEDQRKVIQGQMLFSEVVLHVISLSILSTVRT
jgi:beta-ureidopropionase